MGYLNEIVLIIIGKFNCFLFLTSSITYIDEGNLENVKKHNTFQFEFYILNFQYGWGYRFEITFKASIHWVSTDYPKKWFYEKKYGIRLGKTEGEKTYHNIRRIL